jgi:hypothetical protein
MLYTENIKKTRKVGRTGVHPIRCKCGSIRIQAEVGSFDEEDESSNWVTIQCRACGNILYYNGA